MKALITPNEIIEQGYRVAQICEIEFEVASPLFWIDCDETIIADQYWFDPSDNTFKKVSFTLTKAALEQPISNGTQTI